MGKLSVIQCDGCSEVIENPDDVTRESLRYEGKIEGTGNRDLCPSCARSVTSDLDLTAIRRRGKTTVAATEPVLASAVLSEQA